MHRTNLALGVRLTALACAALGLSALLCGCVSSVTPTVAPTPTPLPSATPKPSPTAHPTARPMELVVLHTNDVVGYTEPCG